jgi:homoserine dehydrogenase
VDDCGRADGRSGPDGGLAAQALFAAGKSVVTANKQLIAYRGGGLARLAAKHGVQLVHGAAVAGGVPVIPGIAAGLGGDQITRISGIVNGTCNYILSRMESGADYDGAGRCAGAGLCGGGPLGGCGWATTRARSCASCRGSRCMRSSIRMQVATQTISTVEAIDFAYAKELNCTIRQVSRAQLEARWCMRGSRRCWCR